MDNIGAHTDAADVGLPSARVLESAVELARAESKLVLSHVKVLSLRALSAVLILLVATSLTQVAILLVALSPVLATFRDWPTVALSVLLPVAAAAVAVWLALRAFKRVALVASQPGHKPSTEHSQ
jgi:hypothetical protein